MYLNVMVTVVAGLILLWLLYGVFSRFFYNTAKSLKHLAKYSGKHPEYYDQINQMHTAFEKGNFEEALKICQEILTERPFESAALSYKAYSLYHLKRVAEAKVVFELLETLPGQDCSKMLEKLNAMNL